MQRVGKLVLNQNAANFFNENEQLAFSPAHIVPGHTSVVQSATMTLDAVFAYSCSSSAQGMPSCADEYP